MGQASRLFFSSDAEHQTLHRRITPSDEQFEEQQERWNLLAEHLLSNISSVTSCRTRSWLQGSYKFGTQIRPVHMHDEFDIDLGIYCEWGGSPDSGEYNFERLRTIVQESLESYAVANAEDVKEVVAPKPRCCRIRYKNKFHIDVPVYHLDPSKDCRTLATEHGWEASDPKAIYVWFRDKFDDATRTKVRRHVTYLKAWAALHFRSEDERPSSILLTVLVADACAVLGADRLGADDETFRDIVDVIAARFALRADVLNPVDQSENLVRLAPAAIEFFRGKLNTLRNAAARANKAATALEAADVWQEAFSHLFPMPDITEALTEDAMALPVPIVMPEVRVTAQPRNTPHGRPFISSNRIGPIPKNCDVYFEVVNANLLPPGSEISWIVRNEGREAENINDLGHFAGVGTVADEHTAYKGTHYMDCIVRCRGRTIAFRRIPVIVTGQEMPRRNPAVKPRWVGLRGRR